MTNSPGGASKILRVSSAQASHMLQVSKINPKFLSEQVGYLTLCYRA
jgi:hypothetical protein